MPHGLAKLRQISSLLTASHPASHPPAHLHTCPQAVVYGVPECNIRGIPYGFKGFQERRYQKPVELTKGNTDAIHLEGGSFLGTCSDPGDVGQIVKW